MIVYFCRGKNLAAEAIKFATFSQFSHVAIMVNHHVYEATFEHGVTRSTFAQFDKRYPDHESVIVDDQNKDIAETWLNRQVGKPYDFSALAALPFRKNWQNDEKWFCSELVACALMKAGVLKTTIKTSRITQRDLWYARKLGWRI
jgi:uncharacterized protein YycO